MDGSYRETGISSTEASIFMYLRQLDQSKIEFEKLCARKGSLTNCEEGNGGKLPLWTF